MADRLHQIEGAVTSGGRRLVQVREVTSQSGQEFTLHELFLVRPNGDWDFVDATDAQQAMRWLCGYDG